jgi:hypothetical protein
MSLSFEKNIEAAFGGIRLPIPTDWPPIRISQEHPNMPWKNFGNKGSVLIEEAFLLYALVRMTKPKFVLDCGTWMGMSAAFMLEAVRDNGFGKVVTIEHHDAAVTAASLFFEQAGYKEIILVHGDVENYIPPEPIDFLMLDTETKDRLQQFHQLKPHFAEKCWVVFHDAGAVKGLRELVYPHLWWKTVRELAVFYVEERLMHTKGLKPGNCIVEGCGKPATHFKRFPLDVGCFILALCEEHKEYEVKSTTK